MTLYTTTFVRRDTEPSYNERKGQFPRLRNSNAPSSPRAVYSLYMLPLWAYGPVGSYMGTVFIHEWLVRVSFGRTMHPLQMHPIAYLSSASVTDPGVLPSISIKSLLSSFFDMGRIHFKAESKHSSPQLNKVARLRERERKDFFHIYGDTISARKAVSCFSWNQYNKFFHPLT